MNLSKPFIAGAALSFFGLLLLAELFLRLSVPTGFWYRHFDFSGDMTGLAELKDRLRFAVPQERRVLLLGDSVLGASVLMEHRISGARTLTLSRLLKTQLQGEGYNTLSLGSDGLLLPDLLALTDRGAAARPEKILLLLNFRMFAKDFAEGPKGLSRNFLQSDLPEETQKRLRPEKPPTPENLLSDRLYAGMCDNWFLFRETQMAKTLWYYPSQKDFFQRLLEQVVRKNETQSDIVEAALKQKVAPYYQPYLWDPKALPLTCLKEMLDQKFQPHSVIVILTPQNQKYLGSYLDKASFEKNRKNLTTFMKGFSKSEIHFEDWSKRYPSSLFLDHCHLTPEGNERYAQDLKTLMEKTP